MESVSFQASDGVRIFATDRVRAWGRGHANHTLVPKDVNPGEGATWQSQVVPHGWADPVRQKCRVNQLAVKGKKPWIATTNKAIIQKEI